MVKFFAVLARLPWALDSKTFGFLDLTFSSLSFYFTFFFFFLFCAFCSAWRWWHSIRLCHLSLEMWRQEGFRHLQKGFILIKHGFTFHWIFHLSSWKMLLSSHLIQNMLSTGVYQHSRCSWRSWASKAGKVITLFKKWLF